MGLYGLLDPTAWQAVLLTLALTHVTIMAVTLFLHRGQAHRGLDFHPAVAHFLRAWLWLTTGMVTKQWVAVHRRHHARCETPEDPHSPQVLGLRKVLTEGAELYRAAAADTAMVETYGQGTPDDWLERRLYSRFSSHGPALMLVLDLVLCGLYGPVIWAVQMLWIPVLAAGVINGVGHAHGYRNFETPDASTNILPWGVLIGGEELHNNHHAFPSSARFSSTWWEVDLGWFYLRLLSALRLARIKRVTPRLQVRSGKRDLDMDTLRAVVLYRMKMAESYYKKVLGPVMQIELPPGPKKRPAEGPNIHRLMAVQAKQLDAAGQAQLDRLLATHPTLATVYQFGQRLRAILDSKTANQEALLAALQSWCQQAEATGIKALARFSQSLRGFSTDAIPAA